MGRELKRVTLDFNWPQDMIWKGYLNPYHSQECKCCGGTGLNDATRKLDNDWYSFDNENRILLPNGRSYNDNAWSHHITEVEIKALIESSRLTDFTSVFIPGKGWEKKIPEYIPTPEEVNEWSKNGMGHDAINRWVCVKARAKHLGVYGKCKICKGEGEIWQSEDVKKLSDDWNRIEPPIGDGFQLWTTTNEGAPISPVYESLELLCDWLADGATTFGYSKATKEEWFEMLKDDFVCHKEGNAIFI